MKEASVTQAVASGVLHVTDPRRIKLLPGIRLNISKSRVSTSVGEPGATINLRGNNVRTTVGARKWIELHQFGARP
jgi:hypothetical protein